MQHYEMVEESASYAAGVFTLGGAVAARRGWADTDVDTGDLIYYRAQTADGAQWEIGVGTYNAAGTIARAGVSARPVGFSGEFTAAVSIAQVVPPNSHVIAREFGTPRAMQYQSAAFAGGIAQAAKSLAVLGAATTHEGAAVTGISATSFAPYVEQFYGAYRWHGTAETYSSQQTLPIEDRGGNVFVVDYGRAAVTHALVIAMRNSDKAVYAAEIRAAIANNGGTPAIVGTPTVTEIAKSAGVTVSASVSAENGGLTITANGNTEYWRWSAIVTGTGI